MIFIIPVYKDINIIYIENEYLRSKPPKTD